MDRNLQTVFIILVLLLSISCANKNIFTQGQWIDLTHEFSKETIYWPTSPTFKKETVYEGHTDKGYYYSAYKFSTAEH
nr:cyclase family protein [Candidatus Dadabacteria bacterium]